MQKTIEMIGTCRKLIPPNDQGIPDFDVQDGSEEVTPEIKEKLARRVRDSRQAVEAFHYKLGLALGTSNVADAAKKRLEKLAGTDTFKPPAPTFDPPHKPKAPEMKDPAPVKYKKIYRGAFRKRGLDLSAFMKRGRNGDTGVSR